MGRGEGKLWEELKGNGGRRRRRRERMRGSA